MEAWRVCRRPYADLSGEGARRVGGRWNRRGTAVVYLAEHPALAVLEVLVHLDLPPELLPDDYVLMRADLPFRPETPVLDRPYRPEDIGNEWLRSAASPLLRVPSVLVPHAFNLLLNPAHRTAPRAKILSVEPFVFDPRFRLFPG
jgi:RES domain-containing protein